MSVVFQRKTSKFDTILISDVNRYTFLSKKHQLVCFFHIRCSFSYYNSCLYIEIIAFSYIRCLFSYCNSCLYIEIIAFSHIRCLFSYCNSYSTSKSKNLCLIDVNLIICQFSAPFCFYYRINIIKRVCSHTLRTSSVIAKQLSFLSQSIHP